MQYYQCKCGDKQMWNSGQTSHDCQGCAVCKTTYAQSPTHHKELVPHDFTDVKYNQNTGKPYRMCTQCREIDIESYKAAQIKSII